MSTHHVIAQTQSARELGHHYSNRQAPSVAIPDHVRITKDDQDMRESTAAHERTARTDDGTTIRPATPEKSSAAAKPRPRGLPISPPEPRVQPFRAPVGLGKGGRRLWRERAAEFDLDAREARLLGQACREQDLVDQLEASITEHGVTMPWGAGTKVNPAVKEVRMHRGLMARLLRDLETPVVEEPARTGARR